MLQLKSFLQQKQSIIFLDNFCLLWKTFSQFKIIVFLFLMLVLLLPEHLWHPEYPRGPVMRGCCPGQTQESHDSSLKHNTRTITSSTVLRLKLILAVSIVMFFIQLFYTTEQMYESKCCLQLLKLEECKFLSFLPKDLQSIWSLLTKISWVLETELNVVGLFDQFKHTTTAPTPGSGSRV